MKKTACLVLSTVVFAFMFSIVALVSPALAEVNQAQQATTLNSQGVSSTAVDDRRMNKMHILDPLFKPRVSLKRVLRMLK